MPNTTKPRRPWTELTALDVMEPRVVTVAASAPLSDVERLLAKHRISGMPVVDAAGRPVGVVSYRDLLERDAKDAERGNEFFRRAGDAMRADDVRPIPKRRASDATAADLMTPAIVDVLTDATLPEICRTMTRHAVHRVLVTEGKTGRMVGIVSSLGVLAALARE